MLQSPTAFIVPTGKDPIGDAIRAYPDGSSFQLAPGDFPRARGPWGGRKFISIVGWDRKLGVSTIKRDDAVGSTDSFILGPGDTGFVLQDLNIEVDDRAAVKTTTGVGPKHALIDCNLYGRGSPHDPNWTDTSRWGSHRYESASWNEIRVWKWSIYGEHGDYEHNQQGAVNYVGGGGGMFGGCDIQHMARQNEGPVGKGDTNIVDRYTEDVCVGQGGSAFTFRGGVPGGKINLTRTKVRLGCRASLATPFNQNICGVLSVDSADETAPGRNDAAWEGKYAEVNVNGGDWEVGTIYPGRTGMIRPVAMIGNCEVFTMRGQRIHVTRAPGAYPMGLAFAPSCDKIAIGKGNEFVGWVEYRGVRYASLEQFLSACPECAE